METHHDQKLLIIAFSFFIFFNYPHSIYVQGHEILNPPCATGQSHSPVSSDPSFPHSISNPKSKSVSPSGKNLPPEANPSSNSDSPSKCDCHSSSNSGAESESVSPSAKNSPPEANAPSKPSKCACSSTKKSRSKVDSTSNSGVQAKSVSSLNKNAPSKSDSNFPSKQEDNPSDSGSPSKSTSHSTKNTKSKLDSSSNSDPQADSDPIPESILPNTNVDPSVKKICESTDFPSLCLATVVPSLNGKIDVHSVLEVSMKATRTVAKIALGKMKRLTILPKPPKLAKVLKDCKESYSTALQNIEKALNAFQASTIGTVNTMLSAVIDNIGDCDDEYSEEGFLFPAPKFAGKLKNMTSNCLAIASLIHN